MKLRGNLYLKLAESNLPKHYGKKYNLGLTFLLLMLV